MLNRKTWGTLQRWKMDAKKKALCIIGARQVGKTTLVREFAKVEYAYFAELNFLAAPDAHKIFHGELDAATIITNLTAYLQTPLVPGKTHYVETGSQLGIRSREVHSYPVGFEEIHSMYPMDFQEFCLACGVQQETIDYLHRCFETGLPVSGAVHETMNKLFYSYIVVGGMPEAVSLYAATHDIAQVIRLQRQILDLYRLDIAKYAQRDHEKIRRIFDAIPAQLDEKNRRFVLADLSKSARQERYESSFLWLSDAGVALPCFNVTEPKAPLQLNEKHSLFKLFLSDTGLLCAACMENIQFALLQGDLRMNMGSILENAIAQQLLCNGFSLHYFNAPKYGEVDFLVQQGSRVLPIEVKSGIGYGTHRALDNIMAVDEWNLEKAYVLCGGNIRQDQAITYLPWYMVMFLQQQSLPDALPHDVDLSALQGLRPGQ